jgi:hypothetical protein
VVCRIRQHIGNGRIDIELSGVVESQQHTGGHHLGARRDHRDPISIEYTPETLINNTEIAMNDYERCTIESAAFDKISDQRIDGRKVKDWNICVV